MPICETCVGLGVVIKQERDGAPRVSVPCPTCRLKNKCHTCGKRKRGAGHAEGAHHKGLKVS